jgi:uncharacterized membrane protein
MRRRGSDGAVAIFVAIITCFVVIPVSAVAVDLGMQRVARRDMQSLADVVALDLSRQLDGRTAATITSASPSLQTLADRSRLRNASAIGSGTTVTPVLGTTDAAGVFTAVSGATVPTAVMVTAHTSVGFVFISGSGQATRTAIAAPTAVACFKLGSFAASIKTGGSTVLGPLLGGLGSGIDLSVLSYQGLASTQVTLGALALALGAGTPTELVNTTVRLDTFYAAVAQALTAQGDTADAAVLNAVKVKLSGAAASTPINVGDLLSVTQGNQSALGLGINAADLIMGAASVADGGSFLSIPGLNVNLPGVTSATTSLKVIEPPKEGCGRANDSRAAADTAQVSLQLSASVLQSFPKVLGLLSVSAGPISLAVQTAHSGDLLQRHEGRCDHKPGAGDRHDPDQPERGHPRLAQPDGDRDYCPEQPVCDDRDAVAPYQRDHTGIDRFRESQCQQCRGRDESERLDRASRPDRLHAQSGRSSGHDDGDRADRDCPADSAAELAVDVGGELTRADARWRRRVRRVGELR